MGPARSQKGAALSTGGDIGSVTGKWKLFHIQADSDPCVPW